MFIIICKISVFSIKASLCLNLVHLQHIRHLVAMFTEKIVKLNNSGKLKLNPCKLHEKF